MKNKRILGTTFIIIIIVLSGLSIATIASVSFPRGQKEYNNSYYFLIRHVIWLGIGTLAFFVTSKYKYEKYKKLSPYLYLFGLGLLVAVLIFGKEVNGAKRWLSNRFISVQPSEIAKLILILVLAGVIDRFRKKRLGKGKMIMNMFVLILVYAGLIFAEKAFSTTVQIFLIGLTMLFISGIKFSQFATILSVMGGLGIASVVSTPYRFQRILSYSKGAESSHQVKQSLIAIGSGKILGKFYGNGLQKYFYLPEIHTDYIFSGYAEETGFLGSIILIGMYIALLTIIIITLLKIKDMYAKYILIGIFGMFCTQILGNLAVVLAIVPSTGIPLPIMSYGGSTTVVVLATLGIVYNIIKALYIQEIIESENKLL